MFLSSYPSPAGPHTPAVRTRESLHLAVLHAEAALKGLDDYYQSAALGGVRAASEVVYWAGQQAAEGATVAQVIADIQARLAALATPRKEW